MVQNTSEKNSGKASPRVQRHSFSYRERFCETRNVRRLNLREKKKRERERKISDWLIAIEFNSKKFEFKSDHFNQILIF